MKERDDIIQAIRDCGNQATFTDIREKLGLISNSKKICIHDLLNTMVKRGEVTKEWKQTKSYRGSTIGLMKGYNFVYSCQ